MTVDIDRSDGNKTTKIEPVSANDWYGGTTIWSVRYEYADAHGGGEATDFFKTSNRYTPPAGPQVGKILFEKGNITVVGIEKIELLQTFTPDDDYEYTASDFGPSRHAVIFDAICDSRSDYLLEFHDFD